MRGQAQGLGAGVQSTEEAVIAFVVEEVNPVPAAEPLGDIAVFEAEGDEGDGAFGLFVGDVEGVVDFFLDMASFCDGAGGEADDDGVGGAYGFLDLKLPVLAGEELFFVELGVEASGAEAVVEVAHGGFVAGGVAEEDFEAAGLGANDGL
jgi:hypothetical protein